MVAVHGSLLLLLVVGHGADSTIARTREAGTAKPMPTFPEIGPKMDVGMPTRRPSQVEQAAARVARVDRRVDLDHRDALVVGAADGADDARGHGVLQAEGAADGEHLVALAKAGVRLVGQLGAPADLALGLEDGEVLALVVVDDVAGTRRPSAVTRVTEVAPAMTWWLVTTRPDGAEDDPAALAAGVGLDLHDGRRDARDGVGQLGPGVARGGRGGRRRRGLDGDRRRGRGVLEDAAGHAADDAGRDDRRGHDGRRARPARRRAPGAARARRREGGALVAAAVLDGGQPRRWAGRDRWQAAGCGGAGLGRAEGWEPLGAGPGVEGREVVTHGSGCTGRT